MCSAEKRTHHSSATLLGVLKIPDWLPFFPKRDRRPHRDRIELRADVAGIGGTYLLGGYWGR
jgi:hypothetical protein